jgi:hypothetical protein
LTKHRALFACLLPVLALAACGGGEGGGDDVARIDEAIHIAALVHRPARCAEVATQAFLEQVTGRTGKAALVTCEEEAEDPFDKADNAIVSKIELDGSEATAKVSFAGLPGGDQTVSLDLVEEGGQWKLDKVTGYRLAQRPTGRKVAKAKARAKGVLTAKEVACVTHRNDEQSRAEAELETLTQAFSSARSAKSLAGCQDSGEREVAPQGSLYSYRVPPGFEATTLLRAKKSKTTEVTSPAARHSGAGITVAQGRNELSPVRDAADLRGLVAELEEGFGQLGSPGDGTPSEVAPARFGGRFAIRLTTTGADAPPFPGTDQESNLVFSSAGDRIVKVICTWGRTETELRLIHRGCDAILRSLRVG